MSVTSETPIAASPAPVVRRIRWIWGVVFAVAAWFIAVWWVGPIQTYPLPIARGDAMEVLGFAEEGSLLTSRTDPSHGEVGVWRWELPAGRKSSVWSIPVEIANSRRTSIRLSEGRRWLLINSATPDGAGESLVIDLRSDEKLPNVRPGSDSWISEDGRVLFTRIAPQEMEVTELPSGRTLEYLDEYKVSAISPNGKWVACHTNGVTRVWRVKTDGVEMTSAADFRGGPSPRCQFSADSSQLLVSGSGLLSIWDLATLEVARSFSDVEVERETGDPRFAFFLDGNTIGRFDTATRQDDRIAMGSNLDQTTLLSSASPWVFLGVTSYSIPRQLLDVRLGTLRVSMDYNGVTENEQLVLFNFETREQVRLPSRLVSSVGEDEEGAATRIVQHPKWLAIQGDGLRIVELPPRRPWAKQVGLAMLLFALPSWWCWRGKKMKTDLVAAPAVAR